MGGTYYVLNLINALNSLPDDEKPEITLICNNDSDFDYAGNYVDYPYFKKYIISPPSRIRNLFRRVINKVSKLIIGRRIISNYIVNPEVDAIYPVDAVTQIQTSCRKIYWIPDFQELHLPDLFSKDILNGRDLRAKEIIAEGGEIVFSSNDSRNDFLKFYPQGAELKTHIFHFASKKPEFDTTKIEEVLDKYKAPEQFYFCANQFWAHKNHSTLFEAVKIIRDKGYPIVVFCSGNTVDTRNPDYFPKLEKYIRDNGLEDNIRILGYMDRADQLAMMNASRAIIQPSLFEGWSTSVEEAKSMNIPLILSDLPIHKEQVTENVIFFKRDSAEDLAQAIIDSMDDSKLKLVDTDYSQNIIQAGRTFIEILQ